MKIFPIKHRFYKYLLGFAITFLMLVSAGYVTATMKFGATGLGTSNIPFAQLLFQPLSGVDGPNRAIAFGNPNRGKHGFYLRLPVGFESPLHYHTSTYHAVVIEGEIVNNYEGQDEEIKLTQGGYFSTKGKVNHITKCLSLTPCVVYVQMNKAFDVIPAGS